MSRNAVCISGLWAGLALAAVLVAAPLQAADNAFINDSRIKTLVYSENEVFPLVTYYGYQSNIEFGRNETIRTISVGDQVAWQIIPSGRHLFIRAMHDTARTNMTVITSKRTYQFDLISRPRQRGDGELSYVMRFYYPSEGQATGMTAAFNPMMLPAAPTLAAAPFAPVTAMPMPTAAGNVPPEMLTAPPPAPVAMMPQAAPAPMIPAGMNVDYTLTGPQTLAPVRIYDDGAQTFMEFAQNSAEPSVFKVNADGGEVPVPIQRAGPQIWVVPTVAEKFTLRQGSEVVCIFNEARLRQAQAGGQ